MQSRRDADRKTTLDALTRVGEQVTDSLAACLAVVQRDDASAVVGFADDKQALAVDMANFFVLLGEARALQRYILVGEPDPRMSEHPSQN